MEDEIEKEGEGPKLGTSLALLREGKSALHSDSKDGERQ
jgi:hypothetical protein